jgi:hypothetical protein
MHYAARRVKPHLRFPHSANGAAHASQRPLGFCFVRLPSGKALCYNLGMDMPPMSVRFDDEVRGLLKEGERRTPLTKQELVRRTLRLHLRSVIEHEASAPARRVTNVEPWRRGILARAYKRIEHEEWDKVEAAAVAAQPVLSMDD